MADHHRRFYTNPNMTVELPSLQPYGEKNIGMMQKLIAREKTTKVLWRATKKNLLLLLEARQCQQWLKKYHLDLFPSEFLNINLLRFATRIAKEWAQCGQKILPFTYKGSYFAINFTKPMTLENRSWILRAWSLQWGVKCLTFAKVHLALVKYEGTN